MFNSHCLDFRDQEPWSNLYVEGTSQLIAALRLHGLYLRVVERMKGQMLHFTVILINKGGGGTKTCKMPKLY